MTVDEYLEAKYGSGGPDGDRFEPDASEVHSSHLSDCERKRAWKHRRGHRSDPSPYFELGRVFETIYGAALAFEHDPDITPDVLSRCKPWAVIERSTWVQQDVSVEIELDDGKIVGECDWVVLDRSLLDGLELVDLSADGERGWVTGTGDGHAGEPPVKKVVETKTKGDLDWVRRDGPDAAHVYQVHPYMRALDCPGEIAYMERDDWSEHVVDVPFDDAVWMDCELRARRHMRNAEADEVPPATPLDEKECRFCPFQHECYEHGGSEYL